MFQARYHDRMKIRAHLKDLNVYRNLQRPFQFSKDIWNAFYQFEVQLKATRQLKEITEQLAKARKARESRRSDRDLKALELKLAECQSVVDEVGDPPLKFLKAAKRVKLVPNTTHGLGQGGIPGLKAAFVSTFPLLHFFPAKIRIKLLLSFCRVK
jgi:predicted RNA-binding Zn ribbon-like protein